MECERFGFDLVIKNGIRSVLDERLLGSDVIVEVRKKVGMNVWRSTAGD